MPKKAKIKLVDKIKNEKRELKLMLSQEEINSLEQLIQGDSGKVDFSEIKELLRESNMNNDSSPSLKKINAPQKSPVMLERDIITGSMSITNLENTKNENNGEFKYLPNGNEQEEKKYTPHYGERTAQIISKKEFQDKSKENIFNKREINIGDSFKEKSPEIESFEKYSPSSFNVERIDTFKKSKKDIFEKKEVKYTPSGY